MRRRSLCAALRRLTGFAAMKLAMLLLTVSGAKAQPPAPLTALRFGALADPSGRATRNVTILVQGDTVVRVGTGTAMIPAGARIIDLQRYTAIPSLPDRRAHAHDVHREQGVL